MPFSSLESYCVIRTGRRALRRRWEPKSTGLIHADMRLSAAYGRVGEIDELDTFSAMAVGVTIASLVAVTWSFHKQVETPSSHLRSIMNSGGKTQPVSALDPRPT